MSEFCFRFIWVKSCPFECIQNFKTFNWYFFFLILKQWIFTPTAETLYLRDLTQMRELQLNVVNSIEFCCIPSENASSSPPCHTLCLWAISLRPLLYRHSAQYKLMHSTHCEHQRTVHSFTSPSALSPGGGNAQLDILQIGKKTRPPEIILNKQQEKITTKKVVAFIFF